MSDDERELGHHAGNCALWSARPCDCGHQPGEHLNSDGEVCGCGEMSPQPGLIHHRRNVGVCAAPVAYTPPKHGPPPGFSAEKWRTMSRVDRREALRTMARTINRVSR